MGAVVRRPRGSDAARRNRSPGVTIARIRHSLAPRHATQGVRDMWDGLLSRFRRRGRSSSVRAGRTRSWLSRVLAPDSGAHGGTTVVARRSRAARRTAVRHPGARAAVRRPGTRAAAGRTAQSVRPDVPGRRRPPGGPAAVRSPAVRSPAVRSPAVRSPAVRSPAVRSPAVRSPAARSPAVRSPAARSPAGTRRQRRDTPTPGSRHARPRPAGCPRPWAAGCPRPGAAGCPWAGAAGCRWPGAARGGGRACPAGPRSGRPGTAFRGRRRARPRPAQAGRGWG